MQQIETQKLLNEIETIKVRLIRIETTLIESEKPSNDDMEAVKIAMKEYKTGKAAAFN